MLLEKSLAYLSFHTFRALAGNADKVNVVLFVIWNSNAFVLYTLKPSLPPFVAHSHFIVRIFKKKKKSKLPPKTMIIVSKRRENSRYPGKTQKSTSGAEISRNLLKPQTEIVILAPLAGNDSNFHF